MGHPNSNAGAVSVVVGAQYGSEGKGAVAAHLTADPNRTTVCVRVAGPNAGHTVIGDGPDGPNHPWRLRTVPVAAVSNRNATLVIAAGSEIDLSVLDAEVTALDAAGYNVSDRLLIDYQATILEPHHHTAETAEQMHERLGSTGKGIGAARADRIMRRARIYGEIGKESHDTAAYLEAALRHGDHVVIEGTQGYGLGLHAGHYPQCTSSDTRAVDFLAMAGISPWADYVSALNIYAVARVYPIRVAGNSGPLKGETTWEALGLPEERTTVTQKIRRVGAWDPELVRDAVTANGGAPTVRLAITMFDYLFPEIAGKEGPIEWDTLSGPQREWLERVEMDAGAVVSLIGTGPETMLEVVA